ncbi:Xylan 1,4-beta-xylosidase, glycosyl hydrolase family 43 [Halorhabdus sp. SVX81]|nr:Xylan 1,4-beta-xylosidase, glycosyl hydrolase family 43 [Halorhabdus sp. SVX81]
MSDGREPSGMQYSNPVLPGMHPDPTIARAGEDFYLAISSFEYFPGVPLFHSTDLVSWERVGHCLTRDSQLDLRGREASDGIYAPTLRHHDGTFYMVTTDVGGDNGGHFIVTADDPAGEWSDPLYVDAGGIDPDLFFDDDGTAYFQYTDGESLPEYRVRQAEIDLDTGELGDVRQLWRGIEGGFAEAPHIYERDGTYYLITAEGGTHTDHMVTVGRSDDPTGPFEPHPDNPVLSHRGRPMHPLSAMGHADMVQAPDGSWWMVFLGIRQYGPNPGVHHLGRETFLAPVTWEDGWPIVNDGEPIDPEMTVESLPGDSPGGLASPARPFETTFDGELDDSWQFRRNPDPATYSVSGEGLTLAGKTDSLDELDATFVGRPQSHFDCRAEIDLGFDPDDGEEAGLALVMNESHHYEIGVGREGGETVARVRLRIGEVAETVASIPAAGENHRLVVDATTEEYTFRYDDGDGEPTELATAATRYLSTEVAGGFTGVYIGPYALGTDTETATPARIQRFAYEPAE